LSTFNSFFRRFSFFRSLASSTDLRFGDCETFGFTSSTASASDFPLLDPLPLGPSDKFPSLGPRTGPRKNLEYKPRLAASRLAFAIKLSRGVSESGVEIPEFAAVPLTGRRLERMPVVVRLIVTADEDCESSCSSLQYPY